MKIRIAGCAVISFATGLAMTVAAFAATPKENMEAVLSAAKKYAKVETRPAIKDYCNTAEWCEAYLGKVQVQIYGRGVVNVHTSSLIPPAQYRKTCSAIFAGLSGSNFELATETLAAAFASASAGNAFKKDVLNVQVEVREGSDGLMGCDFFKY